MLSITSFPRRFPTANKRKLRLALARAGAVSIPQQQLPAPLLSDALRAAQPLAAMSFSTISNNALKLHHSVLSGHGTAPRAALSGNGATRAVHSSGGAAAATSSTPPAQSAAAELHDSHEVDQLIGDRGDDWFTTSRDPRSDPSFPGVDPASGRLQSLGMPNLATCSREAMLDYFDNSWALTDALFATLQGEDAFMTPPPHHLRHPLIFYYGHPTSFFVNKFVVSGLLPEAVNPYFEHIFEVGVDEMRWDDMSKNEMQWPSVSEVTVYRRQVYELVRGVIETHPGLEPGHAPIDENSPLWALQMALEHERIHLETSSMLMQEQPTQLMRKSELLPDYHPSAHRSDSAKRPVRGVDYPVNELLPVQGGRVQVGKPRDFPTFGWDNEYGHREVDVPDCKASKLLVSNGEFHEFVSSGGYLEPRYWSPLGWEWRCFRNTKWPSFWVADGPAGSHQFKLRALFDVLPMQWDWPAQVNWHEAQAFCKWKTERDGQDGRVVYHLTTEPIHQLLRDAADRSDNVESDRIMTVTRGMAVEAGKNLNFSFLSFSPVDALPPTAGGFHDVFGNAWEWCEDQFAALPGFHVHGYYDDFSAPCFDGEHNVILGGSFISSGDNGASKFARYHFRPHFFQHAGFRVVEQRVDPASQTFPLVTTCIDAPGPYTSTTVVGSPFRSTATVAVATHQPVEEDDAKLLRDVQLQAQQLLDAFVSSIEGNPLVVAGNQVASVKAEVERLVVVSSDDAVVRELQDEFDLVASRRVPIVTTDSATRTVIELQAVTAWAKK